MKSTPQYTLVHCQTLKLDNVQAIQNLQSSQFGSPISIAIVHQNAGIPHGAYALL
ncbi:hypothetical protein HOF65_00845 [bacterium]|mgnify:CR=1 FL=1|nr:hypothetical protein [bacterium]MBT3852590.1 hypothetical protein [bacterium]MBT4633612.1 hypothetical protein [bacterium]MBT6778244.1 hypothetical protein [bacterium]